MRSFVFRYFSFRPEQYQAMGEYLNDMAEQGYQLRWCKGLFAAFQKKQTPYLRYVIDPYALSSILRFRHFPKSRMQEYMENGWYAVSRSRGCYIFCTDDPEVEVPFLEEGLEMQVQKTCRNGSFILFVLLFLLFLKCILTPAVLYTMLLSNFYLLLGGFACFLVGYHLINWLILLSSASGRNKREKMCFRYLIHAAAWFLFLITAILTEAKGQDGMLFYMMLPIGIVMAGTIAMFLFTKESADAKTNNRRLVPIIIAIGALLLITIPFSAQKLQVKAAVSSENNQTDLLSQKQELPVLHLSDFSDITEAETSVREYKSVLGRNLLYTEKADDRFVFTNYSEMKNTFLADQIFQYLYIQVPRDYQSDFQLCTYNGYDYYALKEKNIYLMQKDNQVVFCVLPEDASVESVFTLLEENSF